MLENDISAAPRNWGAVRSSLVADVLHATRLRVRAKVCGESMLPSLWPGDEVEIEGCSPQDVRPGEIVLVRRDERLVLHRLVSSDDRGCVLQGDSVRQPDPPYLVTDVVGRLVRKIDRQQHSFFLAIQPGFGAKLFRALGLFLCLSGLARRLAMKLHSRNRASGYEAAISIGPMRVPLC